MMNERGKFEIWSLEKGYFDEIDDSGTTSIDFDESKWIAWQACAEQYAERITELENTLDNTIRQRDGWKEHVEELKLDIKELKNKLIDWDEL